MDRRTFHGALEGSLLSVPLTTEAQQASKGEDQTLPLTWVGGYCLYTSYGDPLGVTQPSFLPAAAERRCSR